MNPRFNREVHKTTVRLLRQLAALHKMPDVMVSIRENDSGEPIELYQKSQTSDPKELTWQFSANVSIPLFLSLDIPAGIAAGGSVSDLLATKNKGARPMRWDMEPLDPVPMEEALRVIGYIAEPPQSK